MTATTADMPRKKKQPTVTVRLYQDVAKQLRIIAALKGQDVADYLAGVLRPILLKELHALGRSLAKGQEGKDEDE